jgi:drug/metabolite transporter (DMT)-like permease
MGVLFAFLCAVCSSAKDLTSKRLASHVDGTTSTAASFLFAIPFYILLLFLLWIFHLEDFEVSGSFLTLVALRSVSDCFAEWFKMTALSRGDISLVAPFVGLSPLFLLLLSPFITGEVVSIWGGVGVGLVVLGTVLAVGKLPKLSRASLMSGPVFVALCSSFFFAMNSCFDRLAAHQASPVVSGFAVTVGAGILFVPSLFRSSHHLKDFRLHMKWFTIRGLFELLAMVLKFTALLYLPTPYVVGIQKSASLFSIFGGGVLFKEEKLGQRIFAGGIVLAGLMVIVLSL